MDQIPHATRGTCLSYLNSLLKYKVPRDEDEIHSVKITLALTVEKSVENSVNLSTLLWSEIRMLTSEP